MRLYVLSAVETFLFVYLFIYFKAVIFRLEKKNFLNFKQTYARVGLIYF